MAAYFAGFYSQMRSGEFPELPPAWLRPTGDPEPPPNWAVIQHKFRVAGAIAEHLNSTNPPR